MDTRTYTITTDAADLIPADLLIDVLSLDLSARCHDGGSDASHTATFIDRAGKSWDLPVYGLVIGTRIVLWSCADGAGVDDITIADLTSAEDDTREYAELLAAGLEAAS